MNSGRPNRDVLDEPVVYFDGFGFRREYYGPDPEGPPKPSVLQEDAKQKESSPESKHFLYWKNVEKKQD